MIIETLFEFNDIVYFDDNIFGNGDSIKCSVREVHCEESINENEDLGHWITYTIVEIDGYGRNWSRVLESSLEHRASYLKIKKKELL